MSCLSSCSLLAWHSKRPRDFPGPVLHSKDILDELERMHADELVYVARTVECPVHPGGDTGGYSLTDAGKARELQATRDLFSDRYGICDRCGQADPLDDLNNMSLCPSCWHDEDELLGDLTVEGSDEARDMTLDDRAGM